MNEHNTGLMCYMLDCRLNATVCFFDSLCLRQGEKKGVLKPCWKRHPAICCVISVANAQVFHIRILVSLSLFFHAEVLGKVR